MPSVSKKQHNLMAMVANNPAAAKRVGIPQSVGAEYMQADKGTKVAKGSSHARPDLQKINKPDTRHGKNEFFSGGGKIKSTNLKGTNMPITLKQKSVEEMKKGIFAPKDKDEKSESAMKKGGKVKKMASGGMTSMGKVKTAAPSRDGVAVKGKTKGKMIVMAGNKGMKKGGYC